jgi:hypothetical protein
VVDQDYQLRIGHYISDPVALISGDFQAQTLTIGGDVSVVRGKHYLIEDEDAPGTFYKLKVNSGVLSIEAV